MRWAVTTPPIHSLADKQVNAQPLCERLFFACVLRKLNNFAIHMGALREAGLIYCLQHLPRPYP